VSTALLVILIVLAIVVIAALVMGSRKARERQHEARRVEADEHREEAQIRDSRARAQEAEAEERAAKAKREAAHADEQSTLARQERRAAEDRHRQADQIDPDVDEDAAAEERARRFERSVPGSGLQSDRGTDESQRDGAYNGDAARDDEVRVKGDDLRVEDDESQQPQRSR